jgi:3-phenylpropionate/cinnamic acid dioxygenase small subunit
MATDLSPDRARRLEHMLLAREIEDFLYTEAELLDERRFEEWLDLLGEDVRYWMPMRRNVKFGEQARDSVKGYEFLHGFKKRFERAWLD